MRPCCLVRNFTDRTGSVFTGPSSRCARYRHDTTRLLTIQKSGGTTRRWVHDLAEIGSYVTPHQPSNLDSLFPISYGVLLLAAGSVLVLAG